MKDNLEHGWVGTEDREIDGEEKYICGWCGEKIYENDEYYEICGEKLCCECVSDCRKYA